MTSVDPRLLAAACSPYKQKSCTKWWRQGGRDASNAAFDRLTMLITRSDQMEETNVVSASLYMYTVARIDMGLL
jgi:hypothetical protein